MMTLLLILAAIALLGIALCALAAVLGRLNEDVIDRRHVHRPRVD